MLEALPAAAQFVRIEPRWALRLVAEIELAALQRAADMTPSLSRARAWLGHAYAVAGQADKARQTLVELNALAGEIPVSSYDIALIHAALGEPDQAFAWLERAYQRRAWDLIQLKVDVRFDSLRDDSRFAALLTRIGLLS